MDDDAYQALQAHLAEHPDAGDLIRHSGGLRKSRWNGSGRGKRGGTSTIYYWDAGDRILMLYLYKKNERSDLTPAQLSVLKSIAEGRRTPTGPARVLLTIVQHQSGILAEPWFAARRGSHPFRPPSWQWFDRTTRMTRLRRQVRRDGTCRRRRGEF